MLLPQPFTRIVLGLPSFSIAPDSVRTSPGTWLPLAGLEYRVAMIFMLAPESMKQGTDLSGLLLIATVRQADMTFVRAPNLMVGTRLRFFSWWAVAELERLRLESRLCGPEVLIATVYH